MDFSEMTEKVLEKTKRPDKREDAKDAINNAISFFSLGASFMADLVEGTQSVDSSAYEQSFAIVTNMPRYRRMKYLKRTGAKGFLKQTDPQRIFDSSCDPWDRWYRSGSNIIFKTKVLTPTLEFGYFAYPTLLEDDDDTHWMLDVVPLMIFNKACAEIFAGIGDADNDYRIAEKKAMDMYEIAKGDLEDGGTPENSQ